MGDRLLAHRRKHVPHAALTTEERAGSEEQVLRAGEAEPDNQSTSAGAVHGKPPRLSCPAGMNRRLWSGVLVVGLIGAGTSEAFAQQTVPDALAPQQATVNAPDVVLLNNGNLFRGTIAEKVESHTIIVLITGETRRFVASEIRYAGPAERLPEAAAAPGSVGHEQSQSKGTGEQPSSKSPGREHQPVYFTSNRPEVALMARPEDAKKFRLVCKAPCKRGLLEGPYVLAVKTDEDGPLVARRQLMLDYPASVELNYRSRAGLRGGGVALFALSLIAAATVPVVDVSDSDAKLGTATLAALSLAIPGLIAGIVLSSIGDAAELKVAPVGSIRATSKREK